MVCVIQRKIPGVVKKNNLFIYATGSGWKTSWAFWFWGLERPIRHTVCSRNVTENSFVQVCVYHLGHMSELQEEQYHTDILPHSVIYSGLHNYTIVQIRILVRSLLTCISLNLHMNLPLNDFETASIQNYNTFLAISTQVLLLAFCLRCHHLHWLRTYIAIEVVHMVGNRFMR